MDKKKNNKREREDDDAPVQAKKRIKVYEADDSDNYKHDPVFFPLKEDGRTIQTNLQAGLIANRILLVGDTARATKISKLFDDPENIIVVDSDKMYKTFTGTYRGVPISIMAIGMGFSRIDIAVREARQIITGPMAMMRLGTCGIINPDIGISKILVAAKGSLYIQSIKSAIVSGNDDSYYRISAPALPDEKLTSIIMKNMKNIVGKDNVVGVLNCTADSFYGSQGRPDHNFKDFNEDVVNNIPEVGSLEMETFGLLHLGTISEEPIYA